MGSQQDKEADCCDPSALSYYQRNRERINAQTKAWVAANLERRREISRESARRIRAADPERARENWRRDNAKRAAVRVHVPRKRKYASDAERRDAFNARRRVTRKGPAGDGERAYNRERHRQKRLADPDGVRARERAASKRWYEANPEKAKRKGRRDSSKRNALKRNADVRTVSQRDLDRLLARQRGLCFHCEVREPTNLDHVVPLIRGGRHSIGNLVWSCEQCNKSKGGRLLIEWRASIRH